jgi:CHASE3 domain sensor protein
MYERRRLTFRDSNVRGALLLGALLACILVVASAISFRVYTQLDAAAKVQLALVESQQEIDQTLRVQLEQETGLRGYLSTDQRAFLDPYTARIDDFSSALDRFAADAAPLQIADLDTTVAQMRRLHARWESDVARPLVEHPHAKDAITRETLGKILVDQLNGDAQNVHRLLEHRLAYAQADLKHRIDEALIGGLSVVVVFGAMGIAFLFSRTQMLAVIDRERGIVEALEGAFRSDLDGLPSARLGVAYVSATEDAAVGGDLYDVRRLDDHRGLAIVADVSGKGLDAAVNTAFVKYSMRTLAFERDDPAAILDGFNRLFLRSVRDPSLFVVAFVCVLDARRETLTYAAAGHNGAFLRRAGEVRLLEVTGPIIGIDDAAVFETRTIALEPGDLIVVATDGLTEARDERGDILQDTGTIQLLRSVSSEPQACADGLVEAVRAMGGGAISDDLAILAIAYDGALAPSPTMPEAPEPAAVPPAKAVV